MAAPAARLRQHLSAPGLIETLREAFSRVPDPRRVGSVQHTLADTLGAALAMFHLKFPSMLGFDTEAHADARLIYNLRSLYRLDSVPDTLASRSPRPSPIGLAVVEGKRCARCSCQPSRPQLRSPGVAATRTP